VLLALALFACSPDVPVEEDTTVDQRLDAADYPLEGDGLTFVGPDLVIEPGVEKQYCMFGTYTGVDVGVRAYASHQSSIGHHFILMGTTAPASAYPDGTVVDCTDPTDLMTSFDPLIVPEPVAQGETAIELPEGIAVKLRQDQRWILQAHYVNTLPDPVRVQDVATVGFVPEDEVTTWAAAFALNNESFSLPPQQETTLSFDCSFDADLDVLYLTGHMHEWGQAFRMEAGTGTDGLSEVLTIPEWEREYRDSPPLYRFEPGALRFAAGDTLRTTCTWFNDSDESLAFPKEMCTTAGMVYPSLTPIICSI
jgi:hypothetical protein